MEHHTLGCVIFDLDGTLLDSDTKNRTFFVRAAVCGC